MNVLLFILIVASIALFFRKLVIERKRNNGVIPVKTILTSTCMLLFSINCFLSIVLQYIGVMSWAINLVLLLLAAYFTKYLPESKKKEKNI
ncbi:hypothetical protein P4679_24575 [Priestia megaterium]|uniref:hypothetical protein n=1 Tax=Priestia megaterium TaxID=1404 RepID=UPI002E1A3964|nr:hypothetical protein [Priestia megaterium]